MATNNAINFGSNVRNVYVSSSTGSDSTGNGTILYPWQTITFAIAQITTASVSNPFQITCMPGAYSETALALKPYVHIDGGNSKLTLSGAITLTGFGSGGQIAFGNFFGMTVTGGITLSPGTAQSVINLYDIQAEANLSLTITGATAGANGTFCLLDNITSKLGFVTAIFSDLDGYVTNSSFSTMTYTATNSAVLHEFDFYSNYFESNVTVQRTGSGVGVISDWVANRVVGSFTASGTGVTVRMDVDSCTSVPSAVSSATITFVNLSNTLTANYSPSNYSVGATNVNAHLVGIDNALASTGSGNIVRATSATLVTPALGTPSALVLTNATGDQTGTTTNDNAAAGKVGQYVSSSVLVGSAISLTSATNADVTSISLTAGDWDVRGCIIFVAAGGTIATRYASAISISSGFFPTSGAENNQQVLNITFPAGQGCTLSAGPVRLSLAGTTTVYLEAQAVFTVSTMTAYGFIGARRVR